MTRLVRVAAAVVGALWVLLLWAAPAMADCGVTYQEPPAESGDCGGTAPVIAASIVAGGAVLGVAAAAAVAVTRAGGHADADLDTVREAAAAVRASPPTLEEIAAQPKALNEGTRTRTHAQVRRISDRQERATVAEEESSAGHRGKTQRHFRVPLNSNPLHPVTTSGGRFVDVLVSMPNGTMMAVEVKMYLRWRTVTLPGGGKKTVKGEVPLSAEIREQVNKDVALRAANPAHDPRWEFHGAGPSDALRAYLSLARIVFVEIL